MNLVQLIRRSRQGVDALLPGSGASSQWTNEEMVDLVNESLETLLRTFRLVRSKWGVVTMNTSTSPFTREGDTYTPSTTLVISSSQPKVTLPPDFSELVRVKCTNDRSVSFVPAESESYHWIDLEQAGYNDNGTVIDDSPSGLVFYYEIFGNRTLFTTPPVTGTYNLEIDYIPVFPPLVYSNAGTVAVTNASTTITGTGTTWSSDGVIIVPTFSNMSELIIGTADITSNQIRTDREYPQCSPASDTTAAFTTAYAGTTVSGAPHIMTMVPRIPREYHRWVSRITSSLMLSKINPELADKYAARFEKQFLESIQPAIKRRQSQDSRVVEDAEEFAA